MGVFKEYANAKALERACGHYLENGGKALKRKDGVYMLFSIVGLRNSLGISKKTFEVYGQSSHPYCEIIERAVGRIEENFVNLAVAGITEKIFSIFMAKNDFGWTDRTLPRDINEGDNKLVIEIKDCGKRSDV